MSMKDLWPRTFRFLGYEEEASQDISVYWEIKTTLLSKRSEGKCPMKKLGGSLKYKEKAIFV